MNRGATIVVVLLLVLSGCAGLEDPNATTTETTTEAPTDGTSYRVEVVEVVDGDTYTVEFPDGHTEDVRLLGVDTPEVHVENTPDEFEGIPTTEAGRDWLRDWGHRASEFARTRVLGKTVRIETDPAADRRGSYGRLLVYVYANDDKSVNERLLEQGYARLYDSSFSQRSEFAADERRARDDAVGMWNYDAPTTTTDGGTAGSSITVTDYRADAPGDDHENPNGEYVTLTNVGSSAVDLSGWTLSDAADHRFRFPDGFTLEPDASVTIYTGSGTDSSTELYWGSDTAIWNNGGDTIVVTDDDGTVVLKEER
ncbi:lamin tail domain-containing protein [Halomicrococcus sp. SG-WS-1]|uniref:lamin tail domain-containing protein n=1 Tax=Halomicrococcus sp. SG-WS-1 TaxID=3439057 RepID=UPI003F7AB5AA